MLAGLGLGAVTRTPAGVDALVDGIAPERACEALVRAGVPVRGFQVRRPSLEETFVALTGEGFDVEE